MIRMVLENWPAGLSLTAAQLSSRLPMSVRAGLLKVASNSGDPAVIDPVVLEEWLLRHVDAPSNGRVLRSEINPVRCWSPAGTVLKDSHVWRVEADLPAAGKCADDSPRASRERPAQVVPFISPSGRSSLSLSEKLDKNASAALDVQADVLALGVDPDNPKTLRIVAETAAMAIKAKLHADAASMRSQGDEGRWDRFLTLLESTRATLRAAPGYVESPPPTPRQKAELAVSVLRVPAIAGSESAFRRAAEALAVLPEDEQVEVIKASGLPRIQSALLRGGVNR